jgi:peptidoglycan/LPS O-acetylase OafA/YrhL
VVVLGVVIMILLTAMLLRYGRYIAMPVINLSDWDLLFRKQVLTQLDSLMYGVLGAFLHRNKALIWTRMPKTLLVTGALIFFFSKFVAPRLFHVGGLYNCVFSFSVTSFATLLLLPFLTGFKSSTALVAKVVTHISLISYSMYLINLSLVKVWILDQPFWEDWPGSDSSLVLLKYTLYWFLVVGLSSLIYRYFEQPIMKLRERFSLSTVNTKEV